MTDRQFNREKIVYIIILTGKKKSNKSEALQSALSTHY